MRCGALWFAKAINYRFDLFCGEKTALFDVSKLIEEHAELRVHVDPPCETVGSHMGTALGKIHHRKF